MSNEKWGSNIAFVLAMIGSAVGLGNIWRYPYVLYSNGGGAFYIPYLVAVLTLAIPFLILTPPSSVYIPEISALPESRCTIFCEMNMTFRLNLAT